MMSSPPEGVSIKPIILRMVDLPEPEGPEIETNSPCSMAKSMPFTASTKTFPNG